MVRHIVMWRFADGTEQEMNVFLNKLQGLKGVIPEILDMEIAINALEDERYHAVLISSFASFEDLETYKNDPRHKAVSALCKKIRTERTAMDYCY